MTDHNGKTIESIEISGSWMLITFTDGSKMEVYARGTEHQWIEVF